MTTIHVASLAKVKEAVDLLDGVKQMAVETFARGKLDRTVFLDSVAILPKMHQAPIVTFDLCRLVAEIAFGAPAENEPPKSGSQIMEVINGTRRQEILSHPALASILALFSGTTITKVLCDGRALADALFAQFDVKLQEVVDLRLIPMFHGMVESDHRRRYRGIVMLPTAAAIVPPCGPSVPTPLHALLAACENSKRGLVEDFSMTDVKEASGRYVQNAYNHTNSENRAHLHPFLPLGVVSPPKDNWVKCARCSTLAPPAFVVSGVCNVCRESDLPCLAWAEGRCNLGADCPYRHELITCPNGDSCLEHFMGVCPYIHALPSVSKANPRDRQPISFMKPNTRQYSTAIRRDIASGLKAPVLTATLGDRASRTPSAEYSVNGISTSELPSATDTPVKPDGETNKNASSFQVTSAPGCSTADSNAISGDTQAALSQAVCAPGSTCPCPHFFGPGGCSLGKACSFAHHPLTVFMPVGVSAADAKRLTQKSKGLYKEIPAISPVTSAIRSSRLQRYYRCAGDSAYPNSRPSPKSKSERRTKKQVSKKETENATAAA